MSDKIEELIEKKLKTDHFKEAFHTVGGGTSLIKELLSRFRDFQSVLKSIMKISRGIIREDKTHFETSQNKISVCIVTDKDSEVVSEVLKLSKKKGIEIKATSVGRENLIYVLLYFNPKHT